MIGPRRGEVKGRCENEPTAELRNELRVRITMGWSDEAPGHVTIRHGAAAFFSGLVEERMVEGGEVSSGGIVVDRLGPDGGD